MATGSAHRRSHGKGLFLTIVLYTSFAHFEAKVATRSARRRSHGKVIFVIIVLFTSFAHFEAKVATRSANQSPHGKGFFVSTGCRVGLNYSRSTEEIVSSSTFTQILHSN